MLKFSSHKCLLFKYLTLNKITKTASHICIYIFEKVIQNIQKNVPVCLCFQFATKTSEVEQCKFRNGEKAKITFQDSLFL